MTSLPADDEPLASPSTLVQLQSAGLLIAIIWGVYLADWVLPWDLNQWGLLPRTLRGLIGIPLMPFLHGGLGHIVSNTIPLTILLVLLSGTRSHAWLLISAIVLLNGILLWLFGRSSIHIGASGLVYGLAAFLIAAGFFERKIFSLLIAFAVLFVFGTSLFWGVLPIGNHGVSWEGHLFGGVAGVVVAWLSLPSPSRTTEPGIV